MKRAWKILLLAAALILFFVAAAAYAQTTGFTKSDRQIINDYYKHLLGTLAPGSIDRAPLPPEMEQALKIGARLPIPLEKKAEPLPAKLESQLPFLGGEFRRYKVGRHVVLVKRSDWTIIDIIKDAGTK